MPADVVGTRIYNQREGEFQVSLGPVFANLLLADEINRAPAKVQSALLEVMQERQVTIGRETYPAPEPVPRHGHPEPDRVRGHLSRCPRRRSTGSCSRCSSATRLPTEEYVVVERMTTALETTAQVIDTEQLLAYQRAADAVYVDPGIIEYAVRLAAATREPARVGLPDLARYLSFGASPRASINLVLGGEGPRLPARA